MVRDGKGTDVAFTLLLIAAASIGTADGLVDAAFSGQAAYLPFDYYQAHNCRRVTASMLTLCLP